MGSLLAYVRRAIGICFDLCSEVLESFAAHLLKTDAIRSQRRALIKIDRNGKLLPDAPACFMGQRYAFVHRYAAHRHKRQNVRRADPWVLAGVRSQIDQLSCGGYRAQRSFDHLFDWSDKRNHRSVMIGIDVAVENSRAVNRFDRPLDASDRFGLAAFTEVWYTLNQIADCGLRIADLKTVSHEWLQYRISLNLRSQIRNPKSEIKTVALDRFINERKT